jgi:hypothetical protein
MKRILCSILAGTLLTGISLAQSSAAPQAGSATQGTSEAADKSQIKIPSGTVIPAELARSIDARKSKQGDPVVAKVMRDLLSNGQVVIPRGAKIIGHVTEAKGREKGESDSMVGIVFDRITLKDGRELPVQASIQAIAKPQPSSTVTATQNQPMSETGTGMPGGAAGNPGMGGMNRQGAPGAQMPPSGGAAATPDATASNTPAGMSLSPNSQGVIGIDGLLLSAQAANGTEGSVISSNSKNVKLDSETQLLLRVQ